jgi:predicted hotdog family 3-hydroxylacyl-ACP dehydratase
MDISMSEIEHSKTEQQEIDILSLLPQQPPFVMVDKLLFCDRETTTTALTVHKDNIFVENNQLTEAGIMENIAQTCAVRMGYINKYIHSDKVKLGFIGAIKNLVIEELPKTGDELKTTIDVVSEVFNITLVNAKVEINEKLIASCEMKISLSDIDSQTNG